MTNAQDVFKIAMGLMDEESGEADSPDTREYKNRTLHILNLLRGELYPYSDSFTQPQPGKRPIADKIADFDTAIGLDDYICQSVLPYGLAAHLLLDENPSAAGFFQQRYEELKALLSRGMPVESLDIEDIYGGIGCGQFGRW